MIFLKKLKNLVRVDDRLIHGQVSVGWATMLDPKYMIIADDEIAASKEDSELYLLGVPFECEGKVMTVSDTADFLNSLAEERFIVVLRSIDSALKLFRAGYKFQKLNIGGIHIAEDRKEICHYLFLNEPDISLMKELENEKIDIFIQDLPANTKYSTDYIYKKWKKI